MKTLAETRYFESARIYCAELEKEFREKNPELVPTFEKLQEVEKAIQRIKFAELTIEHGQKELEEANNAAAELVKKLNNN